MKLLKKSEIASAKASDQKREMDEGLKLAKNVDSLRHIRAEEEASLKKFRYETVTTINKEITHLSKKKDTLVSEVASLEEKKKEAIEPLDKLWEAVRVKQDEVETKSEEFRTMNADYLEKKDTIDKNLLASEATIKRTIDKEARTTKLLEKASETHAKAETEKEEANEYRRKIVRQLKELESSIHEREVAIASRERDATNKQLFLNQREKNLNDKEKEVNDKYNTLLRTLNRKL